jgi:hypothetical protein
MRSVYSLSTPSGFVLWLRSRIERSFLCHFLAASAACWTIDTGTAVSFMRRTRLRWALPTVIVIAIVVVAIAYTPHPLFTAFFCTLALLALATWLTLRDQGKRALNHFIKLSCGGILLSLFSAVYVMDLKLGIVVIGALCLIVPATIGAGAACVENFFYRRKRRLFYAVCAAVCILAIAALPLLLFRAEWPLRWAFNISAPGLEALADRVASGERPKWPILVGLFLIVRTEIEPHSGNVALIVGGDDSAWHGFVRAGSSQGDSAPVGPLYNLGDSKFHLRGRWWYELED